MLMAEQVALGLVLLTAGAAKLGDLQSSAFVLARISNQRISSAVASRLSATISLCEALLGAALLADWPRPWNLLLALALVSMLFAVSVYGAVVFGGENCSCFGPLQSGKFGPREVTTDAVLLAVAVLLFGTEGSVGLGLSGSTSVAVGLIGAATGMLTYFCAKSLSAAILIRETS
jgi:hypothetical protein